ncbi:MAG: heme-binding beta-barrel domain-containing protein [Acidimicrobiales bacterium]
MALGRELGPLEGLQGTWEGADGLDVAYSNERGEVADTPFRERTTFNPFGPVDNGRQVLYGLDYRTAAWRGDEENPFHTEVGYWLWDAAEGQVMRCFMVPRGTLVLAGGSSDPGADVLHMEALQGSDTYGILSNRYLAEQARTTHYEVTVTVGDGVFSYEETTTIRHSRVTEVLQHTDRNTLHRVEEPGAHGEVSRHRQ